MFTENGGRPGDERGFLHKSFIGKAVGKAVTTFVPGASTAVNLFDTGRSFLGGGVRKSTGRGGRSFGRGSRATVPRSATARVTETSAMEKALGRAVKFPGLSTTLPATIPRSFIPNIPIPDVIPCIWPATRDPVTGKCFLGERVGPDLPPGTPVGEAVMGQYGAAMIPGSQPIDRAVCGRGMQLGNDGLCYNKSQITNKQRMWPAGRKPLLSGGDMRAISVASRAATRLEGATKRLQRLGMMKKPTRRLGPGRGHEHAKPVAAVSV